ncbi:hypothetical protein H0Z60_15475 [Ectothiorhodospiraceae bacterium WFHF3C12]|nr:hypothetical protein [Ectothiorhodospiraceae bacterium WFHF3C12]
MKKFSSALALAAAMGLPATGMAAEVDFGAEFEVNGYAVDMDTGAEDGNGNSIDEVRGFQQRAVLNMNMKGAGGVSFHSGVLLSGDTWSGDNHVTPQAGTTGDAAGVTGSSDNGGGGDDVRLDHAYVQVPMLGGVVRTGRMKASWANCFLACDDRRDRIQYLTRLGNTTVFGIYDKRQEGNLNAPEDDGDMWLGGFIGNYAGWTAGSLFIYWNGEEDASADNAGIGTYALTDVKLIAPYVKGAAGPVDLEFGLNYFFGGSDASVFQDTHTSEFIRAGFDAGPVLIEGQVVAVQSGGLVAPGFDTFSSLLHNSPDHDQSPTSVAGVGSVGIADTTDELESQLFALRVTGNVTDQWKLMGAVGGFQYENDSDNVSALDIDGSGTFFDAQVHYAVTEDTTVSATYGMLQGDDIQAGFTSAAAADDEADPSAMSLNLNTRF